MSAPVRNPTRHTIAEWLALPEEERFELIDGELYPKASPDIVHGTTQAQVTAALVPVFHRRGGPGRPGGWWIATEVDIQLGSQGFRPDLVGWRRDRVPELPIGRPVTIRPDWIAEVLSPSNASHDTIRKMEHYHRAGVLHYWIIDPATRSLAVYRQATEGYLNVLIAHARDTVRAEPFDAIEISVGLLFGEERDDG